MSQISRPLSIVIADDHPLLLHGLVELLQSEADMSVLASCTNGRTALQSICRLQPDIAVLDISMPEMTGLEVLANLALEQCDSKIILLTASVTDGQVLTASKAVSLRIRPLAPCDIAASAQPLGGITGIVVWFCALHKC